MYALQCAYILKMHAIQIFNYKIYSVESNVLTMCTFPIKGLYEN